MDIESIMTFLVIGTVAGWLANFVMSSSGFSLFVSILVGIFGAVIGGTLFTLPVIAGGRAGEIVTAIAGAVVLLFFARLIKSP